MMKSRFCSLLLAMIVSCCLLLSGAVAEEAFDPEALLSDLSGTYTELFNTICAPEYDEVWLERCTEYAGAENAEAAANMLKAACVGTIYGQEAMDAYASNPEAAQFDCFFIGGVSQFVFDGNHISGLDAESNVVFDHTYSYVETLDDVIACHVYKTEAPDAGEFTYFCLAPDTPGSTYHVEFRYGSGLEALAQYYEGPLAYWLAAGIPADADETLIRNCIDLFCSENLVAGADAA